MKCSRCGVDKLSNKGIMCQSCVKLGKQNNFKHGLNTVSGRSPAYQLWVHVKHYHNVDTTLGEFLAEHGGTEVIESRLEDGFDLHFIDGSFKWAKHGSLRSFYKKTEGTISEYVGVSGKKTSKGVRFEATLSGRYVKGSSSYDEYECALVRDEYILDNNLTHRYKLNIKDLTC